MWRRRVRAEKQPRYQPEGVIVNRPGKKQTATIKSTPIKHVRITGNAAVAAVDGSPIVGIGNDYNIGLVISGAGNHPRLHLPRVVGGAQIGVADAAANLKTAELVSQKDVDHTCHCVAAINSRGAILQDIDVIDHWERNEIDVHPGCAGSSSRYSSPTPNYGHAFSIDENQSFFGQQTT